MKFETAATLNPIDQLKVVGRPLDRIDGPQKVSGTAKYAYEWHHELLNPAYGYVVGATTAKGRIQSYDLSAAQNAPGVIDIVTAENAGPLGKGPWNTAKLLGGPEVEHYHQAVALVIAETFEQARAAAQLVKIEYASEGGAYDLAVAKNTVIGEPDVMVGDFTDAFASAPVTLDETYMTPDHSHAMMEPHASLATWSRGALTVWTSNQMINWGRRDLATTFDMPEEKVQLISPFIGGGFGGKLFIRSDVVLAALGARLINRPVKVALPRHLVANNTTHRPATIQRLRIGAERSGKITAIAHETWSGNLPGGRPETAADQTRMLYAGAHRMIATRLAVLDLPEGHAMRAPGEAPGLMALEIAMDEMAERLNLDPIEFRALNDTQVDPENPERRFSQRQLIECMRLGAQRFGWEKRGRPGQVRDGEWLIGMGMGAGFRDSPVTKSAAKVTLGKDGDILVETDMTDIGTGSYTIIAQTAAEMLGVPIDRVSVDLGDSRSPISAGSGGQWGANSSTAGVYAACVKLREAIATKAGVSVTDAVFANGTVSAGNKTVSLATLATRGAIVAEDAIEFGELAKQYQISTFAGHFTEVGVNVATAEVRVRRMLAVCAAGRILNPKTARSQVIGAMTMGVGAALMEKLEVDKSRGFFVNHDLAGYEVPVHADIPHQEVIFLEETDPLSSPMKAKGVGELGLCGVGAAIANAVYNATGVRVRDYPITLDKLLNELPGV